MCFYEQQCICMKIWESLLELQRVVLVFCLMADPRLSGVWTFDLRKHSLAEGWEFFLSAKSISVFIFVQDSAVWRIEQGLKLESCLFRDTESPVMKWAAWFTTRSETWGLGAARVCPPPPHLWHGEDTAGEKKHFWLLTEREITAASSLRLWESDTFNDWVNLQSRPKVVDLGVAQASNRVRASRAVGAKIQERPK